VYYLAPQPPPSPPSGGDTQNSGGSCPPGQAGCTPIVLDFGQATYRLTGLSDPVIFDIKADGHPLRIGWTKPYAEEAFLAVDRNGNGRIDDGSELFGNHTPMKDGSPAANGFAALESYDLNGDGQIDALDPIWTSLSVWFDYNHNGITDPGELRTLASAGVTSLSYDYHQVGRRDVLGNFFRYQSTFRIGGRVRVDYDIFFVGE
jgi:hypothetical protein